MMIVAGLLTEDTILIWLAFSGYGDCCVSEPVAWLSLILASELGTEKQKVAVFDF
jgi:hypothetical protein